MLVAIEELRSGLTDADHDLSEIEGVVRDVKSTAQEVIGGALGQDFFGLWDRMQATTVRSNELQELIRSLREGSRAKVAGLEARIAELEARLKRPSRRIVSEDEDEEEEDRDEGQDEQPPSASMGAEEELVKTAVLAGMNAQQQRQREHMDARRREVPSPLSLGLAVWHA